MTVKELQAIIGATPDGAFGPKSREALQATFTNTDAAAVSQDEMQAMADRLGCSVKQLKAVAIVESAGGGFDANGRPKMLYERHLFHRFTDGRYSPSPFSQPAGGGYSESSWGKLGMACAKDPDAAFAACSWGKFQVLGSHWSKLSYASPFALAHSCVGSEAAHYELLCRYVTTFGLKEELRALSADPETCRGFAAGYNGPKYRVFDYHNKMARAMK